MKRHYLYIGLVAALLAGSTSDASAQGFLKKTMQKANEAKEKLQEKVGNVMENVTGIDLSGNNSSESVSSEAPVQKKSATDVVAKRKASTVSWDAPVVPCSARTPAELLKELPAVPTADQIANPTEEDQILFYQAIKRVSLRAEELNAGSDACEDDWIEEWRLKMNARLSSVFGLTPEEMNKLDDPNTSEAERERLQQKMESNMRNKYNLGSEADMEARAAQLEARMNAMGGSEAAAGQMAIKAIEKMRPFYNANENEIKYLSGMSAADFYAANMAQTKYSIAHPDSEKMCPEMQKGMEYANTARKKDGKAYTTREQAFQKKMQSAMQKAMKEAQSDMMGGGAGSMADIMGMGNIEQMSADLSAATAEAAKLQQGLAHLAELEAPMQAALDFDASALSHSLSKDNYKKLEELRNKICATDDPDKYNALYNEAGALISNFRQNAAKKLRAEIQSRMDKVKAEMPGLIMAHQNAAKEGLIPSCAVTRAPFNAVISAADILNDAYSSISEAYPSMVCTSIYHTYTLAENEMVYYPENYVGRNEGTGIILYVKNHANGTVYQLTDGKKQKVTEKDFKRDVETPIAKDKQQKDQTWTSTDGKRKAYFNAEGGILQLPEGEVINSYELQALQSDARTITWFTIEHEEGKINVLKHVYKI